MHLLWTVVFSGGLAVAAQATDLSGIIIYDSPTVDPQMRVWHTSLDPAAAPIGLARSIPPVSFNPRLQPLLNDSRGEIAAQLSSGGPYQPGKNLFTAFWQVDLKQPLNVVTVSFFFNGDTVHPGISVVVPVWAGPGLTYFKRNDAPTLLALYLREVENQADVQYTDGDSRVTLTALMIINPTLFLPIDRVGATKLAPDGAWDATAIIELTVAPDVSPAPPAGTGGLLAPPRVLWPQQAIVGPAEPGTSPGDYTPGSDVLAQPGRAPTVPTEITAVPTEGTPTQAVTPATPPGGTLTPSPGRSPAATPSAARTPTQEAAQEAAAAPTPSPRAQQVQ